jgi:cyclic beta-1,2-glucan synthetase
MYRLAVESLLGLRLQSGRLSFLPCLPESWSGFTLRYRHGDTTYRINVRQISREDGSGPGGADGVSVTVDGVPQPQPFILLGDDRAERVVEVTVHAVKGKAHAMARNVESGAVDA